MSNHSNLPLVSLIIPTYNRCALLRQALESVLAQTYPALEIIVVDDGSTDGTEALLHNYQERIKVIRQANQGVLTARNRGWLAAQGRYLSFLDDDDWLEPDKVARQVAWLEQHPDIGLVHCSYHKCDNAGQRMETIWLSPQPDSWRELVTGNFIWSGGPLVRREYVEKVGGYDETANGAIVSCEDWDLWLRLAQVGCQVGVMMRPLGSYRLQSDSLVTRFAQLERAVLTVLERTFAASNLPAHIAVTRPVAYGQMHLWLSARGFAGGQVDTGQRHLVAALQAQPAWCKQPSPLLNLLRGHALDARIADPPQFVIDLFEHLPDEATFLRPQRFWLLAYAHLGLALRHQANGHMSEAQKGYAAALRVYPALTQTGAELAPFITHYALSLPVTDPIRFAAAALAQLSHTSYTILGDVGLGWAFQAYAADEKQVVPRRVLQAWRHRPALLKNRGAWAILLKSLRRKGELS